jgi:hypothetical protein
VVEVEGCSAEIRSPGGPPLVRPHPGEETQTARKEFTSRAQMCYERVAFVIYVLSVHLAALVPGLFSTRLVVVRGDARDRNMTFKVSHSTCR